MFDPRFGDKMIRFKLESKQKELRGSGVWQGKFRRNVDIGAEQHAKELGPRDESIESDT